MRSPKAHSLVDFTKTGTVRVTISVVMTERRVTERLCRIHPVNLRHHWLKRFRKPNRVTGPKKAGSPVITDRALDRGD
jgi:hypothetical protein